MKNRSSLLNKSSYIVSITILITIIFQGVPASFAEDGSIYLDLRYENGDRVSTWQTILKVFQDDGEEPFAVVEFPDSNPYEIKSLPMGYKYTVEVFVNDMFAEEEFVFLNEPEAELKILIPPQSGAQFVVYYNDGNTPIKDANVSIKSHNGKEWANGNTDSDGKTIRFWLQPNNVVKEDHYIADILLAEGIRYSEFPIKLFPQIIGDLKIITPWTDNIDNLITINVYNENLQKVKKIDGDFVVALYDSDNNKVSQSNVNSRGEAYFSNIGVDRYSIIVIKIAEKSDDEDEVWAIKEIPIIGDKESFSVYKEGSVAENPTITCNCVAFRLDDVQDYYLRGPQVDVMELFQQKNADLTIGIIGSVFGTDPLLVNYIERGITNELSTLEIASHSYSNAKLPALDKTEQRILLEKTNQVFQNTLGITPKTLIPPQNLFDDNTLQVAKELGFTHISGHVDEYESPPYLGVDSEIFYFPANTQTAKLNPDGIRWDKQERSLILDEINEFIDENGYAIVMMHPYEFAIEELGAYTTETDQNMIEEVGKLIDELKESDMDIVTISEINEKIIQPGQEPIEEEKLDDKKTFDKTHCAQQFEPFVDLNNCDLTKQDLFQMNLTSANLSGADLSDSKFMRIDFTDINLSESTLKSVDYFQGILSGANLSGADLSDSKIEEVAILDVDFSNGNLRNIKITNLNAEGSNFSGADLSGAFVKGAGFSNTDFTNAILSDSDFSGINLVNSKFKDAKLDGINLVEATLSGADLSGANLSGANLTKTILRDTNLSNAVLLQIILNGADISDSILFGANLSGMDLTGAGLKGVDLSNADLSGANLSGVDLSGSSLQGTNLSGADLSNVILRGVNLSDTILKGINLAGVDISDSNLDGVDLSNAELRGTDLSRASLDSTSLSGSDLSESILIEIDFTVAEFNDVNFSNSDLSGANLSGINLTEVELKRANLSNADLSGADMTGLVLTNTNLSNADLSGANLSGVDLTGAILKGVNLSNADLSGANLSGVDLTGALFEKVDFSNTDMRRISIVETDLSGINFSGSNLKGADFSYSNLSGADFSDSILESADLSYSNLSGTNFSNSVLESADLFKTTITNADFSGADMTNVDVDFQDLENAITNDETELPEKGFFFFRELYSIFRQLFGF